MQCRNVLRQHVAKRTVHTPSLTLWVSDEQLTEAYARFVKVSNTTRRYGSNVPGPLESRRRQSKRRIGYASLGVESSVASDAEFGAWYGGLRQPPDTYTWQPPTPATGETQAKNFWSRWSKLWGEEHTEELEQTRSLSALEQDSAMLEKQQQQQQSAAGSIKDDELSLHSSSALSLAQSQVTINESSPAEATIWAFRLVLKDCKKSQGLTCEELAPMVAFMTTEGENSEFVVFKTLLQWLKHRSPTTEAQQYVRDILIKSHKEGKLSTDNFAQLIPSVFEMCRLSDIARSRQLYHNNLESLAEYISGHHTQIRPGRTRRISQKDHHDHDLRCLYQQLFNQVAIKAKTASMREAVLRGMIILTTRLGNTHGLASIIASPINQFLRNISWKQCDCAEQTLLRTLLVEVLNQCTDRAVLMMVTSRELQSRPSHQFTRFRMHFWLRCIQASKHLSAKQSPESLQANWGIYSMVATHYKLEDLEDHLYHLPWPRFVSAFLLCERAWQMSTTNKHNKDLDVFSKDSWQQTLFSDTNLSNMYTIRNPVLSLLTMAQKHESTPRQHELIWQLYSILGSDKGRKRFIFLRELDKEPGISIPSYLRALMIRDIARDSNVLTALHRFIENPKVPFSPSLGLIPALFERGVDMTTLTTLVKDKLKKKVKGRKLKLNQNVVDLLTQFAVVVSRAENYKSREAFHSVWQCYRFLHDRGVVIDSALSQALSFAGIIKAILEHSTLPERRLRYIVNITRRYEGVDIADELLRLAVKARALYELPSSHKALQPKPSQQGVILRDWALRGKPNF